MAVRIMAGLGGLLLALAAVAFLLVNFGPIFGGAIVVAFGTMLFELAS